MDPLRHDEYLTDPRYGLAFGFKEHSDGRQSPASFCSDDEVTPMECGQAMMLYALGLCAQRIWRRIQV
jgi:hypothetical protein